MNLYEMFEQQKELTLIDALRDFLPIATAHLELDHIPKIKLVKSLDDTTFGRYVDAEQVIYVVVANRNPVDVLRTLAHEMVHYTQGLSGKLTADAGETGSPFENEANSEGGVIMREFNKKFPQYLKASAIKVAESRYEPQPLPRWKIFQDYYRPWKDGTWQDIMFYMNFAQDSYLTATDESITGSRIADVMSSLFGTDPSKELATFNSQHSAHFTNWDDVYNKMKHIHQETTVIPFPNKKINENKVRNAVLVTALASALASGPVQADPAVAIGQAIGVARVVNKMKGYGVDAARGEATQELNNLVRALAGQGNNHSHIYPLIKDMVEAPGPLPTDEEQIQSVSTD